MFGTWELILVSAAMIVASGFQAFTGFGFSLICTPLLALALDDVQTAVLLLVLPGWFAAGSAAYGLRKVAPWSSIRAYLTMALLGILLGVWALDAVPAWCLESFLILLLVQVLLPRAGEGIGNWLQATGPSAVVAGIAAGALGTPGPPVIAWSQSKKEWSLPQQRGATLSVFAGIPAMRIPLYLAIGLMASAELWLVAMGSIPLVSFGAFVGHRLSLSVPTETSAKIIKLAILGLVAVMTYRTVSNLML